MKAPTLGCVLLFPCTHRAPANSMVVQKVEGPGHADENISPSRETLAATTLTPSIAVRSVLNP